MGIEGYRGIKDYHYRDIDSGTVDFGITDQKGRKIGYAWSIRHVTIEVMTEQELAANMRDECFNGPCGIVKDGTPLVFVELHTTPTRDGAGYGPSFNTRRTETVEQARRICQQRTEAARKSNAKKFLI